MIFWQACLGNVNKGKWGVKRCQVILGWPFMFSFKRLKEKETDMARIYRWVLVIGWLEIRRWA